MPKNFTLKLVTLVVVVVLSLLFLVPSMGGELPSWWKSFLPSEKIRLGLDLQGGMHLILEVEVEKAVASSVERASQELARKLKDENVRTTRPESDQNLGIKLNLLAESERAKFEDVVQKYFPDYALEPGRTLSDGQVAVSLRLHDKAAASIREQAATQALETIRNRVDQFGVSEPEIVPQPGGRILVQLPGVKDTQRAIALIGKTAQLEFKLVDDAVDPKTATKATLPPGDELNYLVTRDRSTGRSNPREAIVIRSRASMTGETITDARVQLDSQHNEPYVSVAFNAVGARQFADLTTRNVKKRLAIVLDNKVQSAPVIQEAITGGEARISGDFTMEEARDLAVVLRSGALPAPVKILEERTVGPSLGRDSINQGVLAALVGGLAVFLFMLVYYKLTGLAADFAVVLDVIIILAMMAAMQATLTLPGIAGIILTMGMAVDANVLINERIREELRLGKTNAGAVEAGYARATVTIIDSHVTTVISALVLYQFGTGPIKGFAVTLIMGLASSLFTAIVVTRLIFDYVLNRFRPKTLSI